MILASLGNNSHPLVVKVRSVICFNHDSYPELKKYSHLDASSSRTSFPARERLAADLSLVFAAERDCLDTCSSACKC